MSAVWNAVKVLAVAVFIGTPAGMFCVALIKARPIEHCADRRVRQLRQEQCTDPATWLSCSAWANSMDQYALAMRQCRAERKP